ncbi:MAG: hypothetical protein L3J57_15300 [Desulfuromusa sp.]|nr:hypothetical protein [Desulfuromusa sp.]
MNTKLERLYDLLDNLVEDFFNKGEMPSEYAYADAVLALAYVESLLGDETVDDMIEDIEGRTDSIAAIFPEDTSIENQRTLLDEQRDMLHNSKDTRNELIFLRKPPNLRLLPSSGEDE